MLQRILFVLVVLVASAVAIVFALVAGVVLLVAGAAAWAWLWWRGRQAGPVRAREERRGLVIEGEFRDETNR